MKLKSASGYICFVRDIDKTAEFYEKLGLQIRERTSSHLVIYLNWYRIDFVVIGPNDLPKFQKEASLPNKGAGIFLYFSVDEVDETHREMLALGLKPSSEPTDQPWGNREFVIRDPDGYKLVIFKRKVARTPAGS